MYLMSIRNSEVCLQVSICILCLLETAKFVFKVLYVSYVYFVAVLFVQSYFLATKDFSFSNYGICFSMQCNTKLSML